MKALLLSAVACLVFVAAPATAAPAPARAGRIAIEYVPPKNPDHQKMYERLKERRALEKLQEFLSVFRLPRRLTIKLEGCNGESNAWYEDDAITICYEYLDEIWQNVPEETTPDGVTPIDAFLGPLFDVSFHEFGHALFDMFKLPVFGREEDAADQVAAYIMLHLGKAEARRVMLGAARLYRQEAEARTAPLSVKEFSNVHGLPVQRFYNYLCIAYGADPKLFEDLVEKGHLPKDRAEGCEEEYTQVAYAFEKLIAPHIDKARAKKLMDRTWLPDVKTPVPRRPSKPPQPQ